MPPPLKIGGLFFGYGGLDQAVSSVIDAELAWVSEIDKGACKVIGHRYPGVPNIGDITTVDWSQVEPVDILTGGSPCQDLSHAGKRAGMTEGTRSNLWVAMREAIAMLRPSLVIWENVRGAYSAPADGGPNDHEPCLCGWADRRRGLRSPGHAQADVPSAGDGRDDGASVGAASRASRGVGRNPAPASRSNGSMGGGLDVADHGLASSGSPECDPAIPATEGPAGGPGAIGRTGAGLAARDMARQDVDGRRSGALRGTQAATARPEQEGASCACPDCGGCVDASFCAVEPCPGCVGDGSGVYLRALGRVLGDLSDLGYDAQWHGLRAADVGAPHGRFRVFVVAESSGLRRGARRGAGPSHARAWGASADLAGRGLLPTPTTRDIKGHNQRRDTTCLTGALLPTPRAGDGEKGGPNQRGSSGDLMLPSAVMLLPTPAAQEPGGTVEQYHARLKAHDGRESTFEPLSMAVQSDRWGQYADAIARWESFTRPAPAPTELGPKGSPRLSARFSEWMMGVPDGWITDVPGITRNEALKLAGNGVVPQQASAAIRLMLARAQEPAA